jgi:hypothetical protein
MSGRSRGAENYASEKTREHIASMHVLRSRMDPIIQMPSRGLNFALYFDLRRPSPDYRDPEAPPIRHIRQILAQGDAPPTVASPAPQNPGDDARSASPSVGGTHSQSATSSSAHGASSSRGSRGSGGGLSGDAPKPKRGRKSKVATGERKANKGDGGGNGGRVASEHGIEWLKPIEDSALAGGNDGGTGQDGLQSLIALDGTNRRVQADQIWSTDRDIGGPINEEETAAEQEARPTKRRRKAATAAAGQPDDIVTHIVECVKSTCKIVTGVVELAALGAVAEDSDQDDDAEDDDAPGGKSAAAKRRPASDDIVDQLAYIAFVNRARILKIIQRNTR